MLYEVITVYEDDACALILGTPALRKLGFALTSPNALGIDLIEPPANYETEYAQLRDKMVEKVHREQGDKKYIDAEKVEESDVPPEEQIGEISFRNSSILVAKSTGQTVAFRYGNKYGCTDSMFTSDESDEEDEESDNRYETAIV